MTLISHVGRVCDLRAASGARATYHLITSWVLTMPRILAPYPLNFAICPIRDGHSDFGRMDGSGNLWHWLQSVLTGSVVTGVRAEEGRAGVGLEGADGVDSCQAASVSPTATRATRAAIGRPPDDCRLFDESTGSFIFEAVRWGTVVGRAFGRGRYTFQTSEGGEVLVRS